MSEATKLTLMQLGSILNLFILIAVVIAAVIAIIKKRKR